MFTSLLLDLVKDNGLHLNQTEMDSGFQNFAFEFEIKVLQSRFISLRNTRGYTNDRRLVWIGPERASCLKGRSTSQDF